jgi:NCS2 family nucleobase:cation symporter-2
VVILPILIGVSSAVCPYLYTGLPKTLELFFASPLTSGSIAVLILGLLFKIGISKHQAFDFSKDKDLQTFMFDCGRLWTLDRMQVISILTNLQSLAKTGDPVNLTLTNELGGMLRAEMVFKEPVGNLTAISGAPGHLSVDGNVVSVSYVLM